MPDFEWDDEDPMAKGYGGDEEESPVQPAPPPPPRPTTKPANPKLPGPTGAVKFNPKAVNDTLAELEESPDPAELTQAEWRLEKAGYYRAVMNSQLLASDHPAAVEVEQELQGWAQGQLEKLLGIRPMDEAPTVVAAPSPFSEDEVQALKQIANRLLTKPAQPAATPAPAPPVPQKVAPAPAKPKPTIAPVVLPDAKRGRGRPRKPCRICGQLACEHKRQPPQQQQPQQPKTPSNLPPIESEDTGETYDGLPIKQMPDGTKYIDAANGRRYKLERRTVTHKETGEQREALIPIELSIKQQVPNAKPYPSEAEAMALAAAEAERNLSRVAALQAVANVNGQLTKLTGKTLIEAALKAEPKEEYVPEAPPRRR